MGFIIPFFNILVVPLPVNPRKGVTLNHQGGVKRLRPYSLTVNFWQLKRKSRRWAFLRCFDLTDLGEPGTDPDPIFADVYLDEFKRSHISRSSSVPSKEAKKPSNDSTESQNVEAL